VSTEVEIVTDDVRQQTIRDARRVLAEGTGQSQRISERLIESREVIDRAKRVLPRAGYHLS
jgi:hypothetical protein